MYAEMLAKYLRKVKMFAWENGPSPLYSNVLLKGMEENLMLACTDTNVGIQQLVAYLNSKPVKCECCVNVFEFSKIIDAIDKTADLNIYLKGTKLFIEDKNFNFSLKTMSSDQVFNIPKYTEWWDIDEKFLKELNSVLPASDELDAPVIYDAKKLFLGNPKALYFTMTDKCPKPFSIDQKYVKKLFIDTFEQMYITEGRLNLKNKACRMFVPTFNGKALMLDPIIKMIENEYTTTCKVNVKEIAYIHGIIKELAEIEKTYDPKITLELTKKKFTILFYESVFEIKDFIYNSDEDVKINIPITHLKAITKNTFVQGMDYVSLKLAKNNRTFITKSDGLFFVGGLWKA